MNGGLGPSPVTLAMAGPAAAPTETSRASVQQLCELIGGAEAGLAALACCALASRCWMRRGTSGLAAMACSLQLDASERQQLAASLPRLVVVLRSGSLGAAANAAAEPGACPTGGIVAALLLSSPPEGQRDLHANLMEHLPAAAPSLASFTAVLAEQCSDPAAAPTAAALVDALESQLKAVVLAAPAASVGVPAVQLSLQDPPAMLQPLLALTAAQLVAITADTGPSMVAPEGVLALNRCLSCLEAALAAVQHCRQLPPETADALLGLAGALLGALVLAPRARTQWLAALAAMQPLLLSAQGAATAAALPEHASVIGQHLALLVDVNRQSELSLPAMQLPQQVPALCCPHILEHILMCRGTGLGTTTCVQHRTSGTFVLS